MKGIPHDLVNLPNSAPMTLDRSNVAHRRALAGGQKYAAHCGLRGQPVTLAQAIAWANGWCGQCFEQPRRHGGK